jgi:glycosyltransferase involved in cell wall biosynthesis
MRILLVTDWNRGRGGAEAYVAGLHDGLLRLGDDVRLLTSSAGTAGDGRSRYVAFGTENPLAQTVLQIANPFAALTVRRAVGDFCPDVAVVNMFAHHLSPAALLPLRKIPSVLLVTDYKCICPLGSKLLPDGSLCGDRPGVVCARRGCVGLAHWLRDVPRYALIRSVVGRFRRILACSEWVCGELRRHGIPAEPFLNPSPAPSAGYRRDPAPSPQLLFVGRLDREKGVDRLLRAFARLGDDATNVSLRIAGQGPLRRELEDLSERLRLGGKVSFLGWKGAPAIERELSRAWALVVPSLWAEPLGLVAIEAVIRGVPVVASERGGLAEIVESGTAGLLFRNGDDDALAECLRRVVRRDVFADHCLPEDVVDRTRRRFDENSHISDLRQILAEVAAG